MKSIKIGSANKSIFTKFYFDILQKWQEESDRMREKLLSLIGRIGRDGREPKTTTRVRSC